MTDDTLRVLGERAHKALNQMVAMSKRIKVKQTLTRKKYVSYYYVKADNEILSILNTFMSVESLLSLNANFRETNKTGQDNRVSRALGHFHAVRERKTHFRLSGLTGSTLSRPSHPTPTSEFIV